MAVSSRVIAIVGGTEGPGGLLGHSHTRGKTIATTTSTAAVESAIATLEADAATPTQAHVTALRTIWNALKADPAGALLGTDFVLAYDATAVATHSKLRALVREALQHAAGDGALKP